MPSRMPLVIGHRGAPGYRPEHSRASYEQAIAMGVDAVEPDVVATRDGVLVVRHENEISTTTDVADHPEFAGRRTLKTVDGTRVEGWFTEDFTWDELATLRCRERLPGIRPASAAHDGAEPILRLGDVLRLVQDAPRPVGVVVEIKHATYFAGIGLDLVPLIESELRGGAAAASTAPLVIESFEQSALTRLQERGVVAEYVYLIEAAGSPYDLVAARGSAAPTYADAVRPEGLDRLAAAVDGISVAKSMILAPDAAGRATSHEPFVDDAHARGLRVFTWTCRPENIFLSPEFRGPGGEAAFGRYEAEWDVLLRAGVDGVFVDHADLGVATFRTDAA